MSTSDSKDLPEYFKNIGARGKFDLSGHVRLPDELDVLVPTEAVTNLIVNVPDGSPHAWIQASSYRLGDWRAELRSTYMRWAIAINGVHVAADYYASSSFKNKAFLITTLRASGIQEMKRLDGPGAQEAHLKVQPMLASFGLIDMYACLEELVLQLCEVYMGFHVDDYLIGPEFKQQRKLRKRSAVDAHAKEEWETYWAARIDNWRRKKIYEGIENVFLGYINRAGLEKPSTYTQSTPETWAQAMKQIAVLRNHLIHGATVVTEELEEVCNKTWMPTFVFKKGEPLRVKLEHLMMTECFCDQLLTALNLCWLEKVYGRIGDNQSAAKTKEASP